MSKQILHIAPTPFFADRGCHIRIEGIMRCLDELGYDNTVCTYHHGRDVESVRTRRISNIKNYTQTAAGPSKYKLWADWKLFWLSFAEYKRRQPIALHAHLHEGLMIALILKILFFWRGTPVVADMQGSLTGELESHGVFTKWPLLRWPTRIIESLLMWLAGHIVCSSSHALTKIRDEFNIAAEKISLVQDGADKAPTMSAAEISALKNQLGLPADKIIVVYSGALLEAKGLSQLQNLIATKQSNAHFLVIGYPEEELEAFLAKNDLAHRCTLTGQVDFDQLSQYLSCADIALDPKHSSAGEGSGKMLNYMACALPVLAFDTQNNRDFLPRDSLLAKDQAELAAQLHMLLSDSHMRVEFAQKNLAQFEKHYSWRATREQLAAVYNKLQV